ncbi:MAG: response regulator [Thiomargarita sp.]|nr:response regulator [Thiomargarita sp.]
MSAGERGDSVISEDNEPAFKQEIELVDMGHDLLTPTSSIIAYTEMLLEFTNQHHKDFSDDVNRMLTAGEQLSNLITQLFSKKDNFQEDIDFESFSSNIRHDLRTPINAIIGYGEMLFEDFEEEGCPDACGHLQRILTSARRLLTLISDLSYLSKKTVTSKPLDIKALSIEKLEKTAEFKVQYDIQVLNKKSANNSTSNLLNNRQQEVVSIDLDEDIRQAPLLVVDDKETNRDLLTRRLERQGFTVEVAENGIQALEMLKSGNFELVLLDIIMPEMDGYQVLEEIRADKKLSRIPVIMISALDEIDSVVHCIEMGAQDYLQKPFNQVILNAKISATLERKRLRDREHEFLKKIQKEQEKSEKLLLNILPQPIAERLKKGEHTIADSFPEATVLFSDLVGFTELSAGISASELVKKLNQIFSAFDQLTKKHGLEKIKTIGDAYMLVAGVPTPRPDHAKAVASLALDMLKALKEVNEKYDNSFRIRVGIHSGPVVAGVIGKHKFNYDLWGDTVNIASRMESQGVPDKIQVSEVTYQLIKDKFRCEPREPIEVKGKGIMTTYLLKGLL